MREPRPIIGARAPLFERLVDTDRGTQREPTPLRVLDREALLASVLGEIARLLNTRWPGPPRPGREGFGSMEYGVPDFGGRSPASIADRDQYAAALARALARFEPRLSDIHIQLEPAPGDPVALVGTLSAQLRLGRVLEPVSFPLQVQTRSGAAHIGDAVTGATP